MCLSVHNVVILASYHVWQVTLAGGFASKEGLPTWGSASGDLHLGGSVSVGGWADPSPSRPTKSRKAGSTHPTGILYCIVTEFI